MEREGEKAPTKWVQLSFEFPGEELMWRKISISLETARSWAASCEQVRGGSKMECVDGDLSMELVVGSERVEPPLVLFRREVGDDRQDEEDGPRAFGQHGVDDPA